MEEQLISYETAKLANDKGFKGKLGIGVKYNLGQYYNHEGKLNGSVSVEHLRGIVNNEINPEPLVAAPTQSLLQKWLRDVHNIHIIVEFESGSWHYIVKNFYIDIETNVKQSQNVTQDWYLNDCDTYEEALEIGLQEALKLITNK